MDREQALKNSCQNVFFERVCPEQVGMDTADIENFLDRVEEEHLELHSFMLLRYGKVAAEGWWHPYRKELLHHVYSFSKSFVSIAVGLAIHEGYFGLEDKIAAFFPEKIFSRADRRIYDVTVRHLLDMSAGSSFNEVYVVTEGDWVERYLNEPLQFAPGTQWQYNSMNTYLLSAVIKKMTGQGLCDFLKPRLFEPLGIDEFFWTCCPNGIEAGGWGLHLKTEDLAKFAQLCLQRGEWRGTQLVPSSWIDLAASFQIDNSHTLAGEVDIEDNVAGYGFQFWMCRTKGIYRADGAFGQFAVIWPEKGLVCVTTSGQGPQNLVLNALWDTIIFPLETKGKKAGGGTPWIESARGDALKKRMENLSLLPEEEAFPSREEKISGTRFLLHHNLNSVLPFLCRALDHAFLIGMKNVGLTFGIRGCELEWKEGAYLNSVPVAVGGGKCAYSFINIGGHSYQVACYGRWKKDGHFEIRMYFVNTPHARIMDIRFLLNGEGIQIHFDELPTLKNSLGFVFDMKMVSVPFQGQVLNLTEKMVLPVSGLREPKKGQKENLWKRLRQITQRNGENDTEEKNG